VDRGWLALDGVFNSFENERGMGKGGRVEGGSEGEEIG